MRNMNSIERLIDDYGVAVLVYSQCKNGVICASVVHDKHQFGDLRGFGNSSHDAINDLVYKMLKKEEEFDVGYKNAGE